uniref:ATP synthase F0 subunit 8 n=1 Tax=Parachtes riberai TaxID=2593099 RepID=A0A516IM63_9ARAC|nr:ATP synthase F0 subunit 8 [Parachtes riberai]
MPQLSALPWILYFLYSILPLFMLMFVSTLNKFIYSKGLNKVMEYQYMKW